jgi:23S rRNA-/tRNA-specific pseudouridylate synthase
MNPFLPLNSTSGFGVASLIIAAASGIVIPIIIVLVMRYRSARQALESKKEMSDKELNEFVTQTINERIGEQNAKVSELTKDFKEFLKEDQVTKQDLRSLFEKLSREHLQQLLECQKIFINKETYKRDASIQKHYMKVIYGTIKEHANILEAELNTFDEDDE